MGEWLVHIVSAIDHGVRWLKTILLFIWTLLICRIITLAGYIMNGALVLLRGLEAAGVQTIFTLSGNQIMPVFDASLETDLRLIHTRHEAAAVYMAEAHAQMTGGIGVAMVTAGAGLGNAIAPLLTARASQTPVLLLSGDSPVGLDGRGAFQEMDQAGLTASATKLSRRVMSANTMAADLQEAIAVATSGQPGPVHLSLPQDMLTELTANPQPNAPLRPLPALDLAPVLEALSKAEKPLILLGPSLRSVAIPAHLPAVVMQSPRGANDPALGAFSKAWAEADLVVSLGKPIDFCLRLGAADVWPQAQWITVHGDQAETERAQRNLGDRAIQTLTGCAHASWQAISAADLTQHSTWAQQVAALCAKRPAAGPEALTSAQLCNAVAGLIEPEGSQIFVMDGGEFGQWAQAMVRPGRRIVNGVSGAIGGGIPYAMAAKATQPQAEVIALMGDGTAGFHLMEFETAVREDLPFIAVIGNDGRWNAEHEIQLRDYGADRTHSCGLSAARYDLVVEAMGGFGAHVTQLGDLRGALEAARASRKPACINVMIDGQAAPTIG